jgi:hypothetical protein
MQILSLKEEEEEEEEGRRGKKWLFYWASLSPPNPRVFTQSLALLDET